MAAYGAAVSLLNTLKKLQTIPDLALIGALFRAVRFLERFLVANREAAKAEFETQIQVEALFQAVDSLRCFLVENREVKAEFETRVRDAIYEAQDIIDSHMCSAHFLSPSEAEISNKSFHEDLERVTQKITLIAQMTTQEFNHLTLDRKISASVWRHSNDVDRFFKGYRMIGRDEDINELKDRLMNGSDGLQVVPIVGVAGMGKTALASSLFNDPTIVDHFDAMGWVKVSVKCSKHDKLLDILASLRKSSIGLRDMIDELVEYQYSWSHEMQQQTDDQLVKHIKNSLKYKRYIILLDDIRDVESWNDLKELFPDYYTGSRILLTTRDVEVTPARPHLLDRLSNEVALALLEEIVFDGEPCPAHLAVIGKRIAMSCRGLPHAVVIVGKLLSFANPIAEYWEIVLSSIDSTENYADLIEALLSLTYSHLPQQLKVCLLYLAIFPYNCDIPWDKFQCQWIVEGFVGEKFLFQWILEGYVGQEYKNMIGIARKSAQELLCRGFLVCTASKSITCLSSRIAEEVLHDFLVRKAEEENFFLVINKDESYAFRLGDAAYNQQRRLCIQQNIYHFIKDLSTCNTNSLVRSLIYSGPEPQYRMVKWSEEFKLLEVFDAAKIGFYTIPPEILKLIQLKYLAFSYNGQLPPALGNLQRLQLLIVLQYLNMKCSGVPSYLPVEIWNLKDLMHLQVEGSDLPEPPTGTKLENLKLLLGMSARSCTRNIFERIPNLLELEVRIESSEEDESLSFFNYLGILNLNMFDCSVIYPDIGSHVVPYSFPSFPCTLQCLTLNGCGFPWQCMRVIARLPFLKILTLQNYAFQGPEWEVMADGFSELKTLVLEDMDFKNWTFNSSSIFEAWKSSIIGNCYMRFYNWTCDPFTGSIFPVLERLIIRNCYKLRHIPSVFADSKTLQWLEVIDCSTSAMNSALQIKEMMQKQGNNSTVFDIYSSLDE